MKKILTLFLIPLFFIISCNNRDTNIGTAKNPLIIALSFPYYSGLEEKETLALQNLFSRQMSMIVKLKTYEDSVNLIESIGEEKSQLALITLDEYLLAREEYKVKPILQVLRNNNEREYFSVIATNKKKIKNVEDLNGKKIGSRSYYSLSGFILPSIYLSNLKIKADFIFTGSHEESLKELKENKLDAISVYKKLAIDNKLRILVSLGSVPNEPFVCAKYLNNDICEKAKNSLLNILETQEGKKIFSKMADITGFTNVSSIEYQDIHQKILSSGENIYNFIPDGIKLRKLNDPYYID